MWGSCVSCNIMIAAGVHTMRTNESAKPYPNISNSWWITIWTYSTEAPTLHYMIHTNCIQNTVYSMLLVSHISHIHIYDLHFLYIIYMYPIFNFAAWRPGSLQFVSLCIVPILLKNLMSEENSCYQQVGASASNAAGMSSEQKHNHRAGDWRDSTIHHLYVMVSLSSPRHPAGREKRNTVDDINQATSLLGLCCSSTRLTPKGSTKMI